MEWIAGSAMPQNFLRGPVGEEEERRAYGSDYCTTLDS